MIQLGDTVKCKLTGFTGVCEAKVTYLNGCLQFLVRPKKNSKEDGYPSAAYIDVENLGQVKGKRRVKLNLRVEIKAIPSGGVRKSPPDRSKL